MMELALAYHTDNQGFVIVVRGEVVVAIQLAEMSRFAESPKCEVERAPGSTEFLQSDSIGVSAEVSALDLRTERMWLQRSLVHYTVTQTTATAGCHGRHGC